MTEPTSESGSAAVLAAAKAAKKAADAAKPNPLAPLEDIRAELRGLVVGGLTLVELARIVREKIGEPVSPKRLREWLGIPKRPKRSKRKPARSLFGGEALEGQATDEDLTGPPVRTVEVEQPPAPSRTSIFGDGSLEDMRLALALGKIDRQKRPIDKYGRLIDQNGNPTEGEADLPDEVRRYLPRVPEC